jgi:taurine dioxygenase
VDIKPLSPTIGAEVSGIDLREDLADGVVDELREAFLRHLVLFFRDQDLTDDQHVMFAARFGPISIPAFGTPHSDRPEITVLDQTEPRGQLADRWHSDNTFMPEPPMGSVLRGVVIPAVGGDTCFANMYDAYDLLSERMKAMLDGLTAVHDITPLIQSAARQKLTDADVSETQAAWPPVEHPIVRTHPDTGRPALFAVSDVCVSIPALSAKESDAVLGLLFDVVRTPEVQCRFHWERNSIAFWDNRAVQHYAIADYRERRVMRRVTIAGTRPV